MNEISSRLEALASIELGDERAVRVGALALEETVLGELPARHDQTLVENLREDIVTKLQNLYEKFETNLEYEFAGKIVSSEARTEDYPLYERFHRLVQAEVELAQLKPTDHVLFIGSGPFPISPILYARLAGVSVDCLDSSAKACAVSQKVVDTLGLNEKITIINADGRDPEISAHDIVVIALLAQPKFDICFNIKWRNPENTPVIVRYVSGDLQLFYRGMDHHTEDRIAMYSLSTTYKGHRAQTDDIISSRLERVRKYPPTIHLAHFH